MPQADLIERAAMDYALDAMRKVWPPHPKMPFEQANTLAVVASRTFWRAYREARDVLAYLPPETDRT